MKRSICFILVIILTFPLISSQAESINLATMSLDELQALSNSIKQEIASRFGESQEYIGSGVFVVGENIKSGNYNLTTAEPGPSEWGYVAVYLTVEDYRNKSKFSYTQIRKGESITLSLKEGMVVEIGQISSLKVEECLSSWLLND